MSVNSDLGVPLREGAVYLSQQWFWRAQMRYASIDQLVIEARSLARYVTVADHCEYERSHCAVDWRSLGPSTHQHLSCHLSATTPLRYNCHPLSPCHSAATYIAAAIATVAHCHSAATHCHCHSTVTQQRPTQLPFACFWPGGAYRSISMKKVCCLLLTKSF